MKQPPNSLHRLKLHIHKCNYIVTTNGSQGVGTERIVWQNRTHGKDANFILSSLSKVIDEFLVEY